MGHALGDLVLVEVARRLHGLGDPVEVVARPVRTSSPSSPRASSSRPMPTRSPTVSSPRSPCPSTSAGCACAFTRASASPSRPWMRPGRASACPPCCGGPRSPCTRRSADHRGMQRYSDDLERSSLSRLALASELADSIDKGEFRLEYQPKVDALTGLVTGVEALVRWSHPDRRACSCRTLSSPSRTDRSDPRAHQLGAREGALGVRRLAQRRLPHPRRRQPLRGHGARPAALRGGHHGGEPFGLPPGSIELEIAESAIMFDPEGRCRAWSHSSPTECGSRWTTSGRATRPSRTCSACP